MTTIDRILRNPEVRAATGYGQTKLWQLMRDGLFPRAINLGGRMRGHLSSEIAEMISARVRGASDDEIRSLVKSLEAKRQERAA